MNFYEFHQPGEELDESHVYLAAKDLMNNGFQVIPLKKGDKEPANIKSVYSIIARPINEHNFNFYFKDRDVDLGIIMDHNMEFIDVDAKNKPGITEAVLKAIRSGWPDLYDKLVIDFTPSGGCHLIYRSEVTGGKPVLAKVHGKNNPLAIIERISRQNKQYIKISPSQGYELRQKNPFEIPFLSAEERNFISAVCASFNEVVIPEVKKKESLREDSPWSVFNSTHDWKYISGELVDRNWIVYKDDNDKIYVRRPGDTKQKYSGVIFKESNILYLFTPSTEFENEKGYTPFGVYCLFNHDGDVAAASKQLASEGCGVNVYNEGVFWFKEKSKIKIKYTELLNWFHGVGYRKYKGELVRVINNTVEIVKEADLKRAFLNEVEFEVKDEMYEKVATIFSDKGGLMAMLEELGDNFIKDDKDTTWLFFQNIATKITPESIDPVDYKTMSGYIWQSDIIDREYYGCDYSGCDAERFINILGGDKSASLQKILGYLLSKYKDPINPRAVVLMEDIDPEAEGESQGGSGKGLCVNFIKQFRKTADFDGKNFRFSDPFLFQNVDPDTAIIFIDDVEKNFKFTSMYSILTGPILINKKNRDQVIIPYEQSPKIVFTSNYSIGNMDISSRRRKYEFPVVKYFGEDIEPIQVFGRQFFSGWDRSEWLKFDNFMIACAQKYLQEGDKRSIGAITDRSAERSLISNTSREFVEYMDGQLSVNFFDFAPHGLKNLAVYMPDGTYVTNAVNVEMYLKNPENPLNYFVYSKDDFSHKIAKMCNYKNLTTTRVTQWMNKWAEARGVEIDSSYKRQSDGTRMYRIVKWDSDFLAKKQEEKLGSDDPQKWEQDQLPF
jgi:hypothetical protein